MTRAKLLQILNQIFANQKAVYFFSPLQCPQYRQHQVQLSNGQLLLTAKKSAKYPEKVKPAQAKMKKHMILPLIISVTMFQLTGPV